MGFVIHASVDNTENMDTLDTGTFDNLTSHINWLALYIFSGGKKQRNNRQVA